MLLILHKNVTKIKVFQFIGNVKPGSQLLFIIYKVIVKPYNYKSFTDQANSKFDYTIRDQLKLSVMC